MFEVLQNAMLCRDVPIRDKVPDWLTMAGESVMTRSILCDVHWFLN